MLEGWEDLHLFIKIDYLNTERLGSDTVLMHESDFKL